MANINVTDYKRRSILDIPEKFKNPGMHYRFIRNDEVNINLIEAEGYVVDKEIAEKMGRRGSVLKVGDLILAKKPKKDYEAGIAERKEGEEQKLETLGDNLIAEGEKAGKSTGRPMSWYKRKEGLKALNKRVTEGDKEE